MPIKYLNRNNNSTAISAGNSVLFNGSNQYLTTAPGSSFLFGTSPFTIEMWLYPTVSSTNTGIFDTRNTSNSSTGILIRQGDNVSNGGVVYVLMGSGLSQSLYGNILLNYWSHVAFVRNSSGSGSLYINGTSVSTANMNANVTDTNFLLSGFVDTKASPYGYTGYISNLRVVNGTAVYTSSFTPSTTPLTAITNTSLLTCNAATIIDGSTNNFTITNNGAATVSSTVPFTASFVPAPNGIKFRNRNNSGTPTPTGNSVQFNGSSQYLSLPNNAALNLGSNNFTMEAFVYIPNVSGNKNIFYINGNASSYAAMCLYIQDSQFAFLASQTSGYPWTLQIGAVGPTISSNTWYHVAATRSGNSFYVFVNGTLVSGAPYSLSGALYNGTTNIIGYQPTVSSYFNGYITNARIINGTALYTASFTAPTAPLTAIANTSLLTCNSATIVDNSSNNLTITNNNSATVSSTTPFTVVTATSAVKMKKVYSDPVVLFGTQKAIFGYGYDGTDNVSMTNLVSNTGVVAIDTTGVGTTRRHIAAAGYGIDKAIFGYGYAAALVSMTNLVSNTGVVATDTTGVGTTRRSLAAAGYGTDKAIFGYGVTNVNVSMTNLVSNTGIVSTDTTGVGTIRRELAAAGYGNDKSIFGYGESGPNVSMTNLVSNTGVVATDTTGVGTARWSLAAAGYGGDKAIFGYGYTSTYVSIINKVSNTGVVSNDTTGVGTDRYYIAASSYGGDKAIFGYGQTTIFVSMTNLVSNTGVVASDTTGVGTSRSALAAAGYSLS